MTDFWIDHSSRGTKLAGALEYMSPEEVEGKELTRSSNIYCFGIILYEALTGKVPFFGPNPFEIVGKIIGNPPVFPRKIASTIPDWMEEITLRCLEKNPKNRFSSAAEISSRVTQKQGSRNCFAASFTETYNLSCEQQNEKQAPCAQGNEENRSFSCCA